MLELQVSGAGLLEAVIVGAAVFAVLRLLRHLPVVLPSGTFRIVFQRAFPVARSVLWVLFTIWAFGLIFVDRLLQAISLATVLAVAVIWLTWFAARDFIAGLVLRLQDDYEAGQQIRIHEIEGRISKVGVLGIDLEQGSGEIMKIPYSKITGRLHSRRPRAASSHHRFEIQVPKQTSLEATVRLVRESALTSPWSSTRKEPLIRRISETSKHYTFEVAVYGIGSEHSEAIERDMRSHLGV